MDEDEAAPLIAEGSRTGSLSSFTDAEETPINDQDNISQISDEFVVIFEVAAMSLKT